MWLEMHWNRGHNYLHGIPLPSGSTDWMQIHE